MDTWLSKLSIVWATVALSVASGFAAEIAATDMNALIGQAEHNDATSQMQLVQIYLKGDGGKLSPDQKQAVHWMERAAALGVPEAEYMFGVAHLKGVAPNANTKRGMDLLQKAADGNYPAALRVLAFVYSEEGPRSQPELALRYMTKAAELGDPEAQNDLGEIYRRGEFGVKINYHIALQWFRKSDASGFPEGIKNVGKCYHLGQGVPVDLDKALECYRRAGAKGNLHAIYNSGMIYRDKKQYTEAVRWLEAASAMGHLNAMDLLGDMYRDGQGVPRDPVKAFELYRKAADQGLQSAFFSLARAYENGRGTVKNAPEAFRCMSAATKDGNATAQKVLGDYYRDGVGVAADGKTALGFYQQSANQGYAPAKTAIGLLYEKGTGVTKNLETAIHWYELACGFDDAGLKANPSSAGGGQPDEEAFGVLGLRYWDGIGVKLNKEKAIVIFKRGADLGDELCRGFLGVCYSDGYHVEANTVLGQKYLSASKDPVRTYRRLSNHYRTLENFVECRIWTERAARENNAEAQCTYAQLLDCGLGGPSDPKAALSWYEKAASQGHPEAIARLPALRTLIASSGNLSTATK